MDIDVTYNYTIYNDKSVPINKLNVSFLCDQSTGFRVKTKVQNQQKIDIKRSHIKINNIYATYLKGWNKGAFWSETPNAKHLLKNNVYYLSFPEKNIKIVILSHIGNFRKKITIPSCCRLTGLIELIKKIVPENAQFYYKNRILNHRMTFDEYGITDGSLIEAVLSEQINHTPLGQQMDTGSSYASVSDFEKFFEIKEKIDIVCQIIIPSRGKGSGFIIDDYLIMTNYHVAKEIETTAKARFMFNSEDEQGFEVDIDKNIVCFSEDPGNKFPSNEKLDYAILRLLPNSNLSEEQRAILKKLNRIGKRFFENALNNFELTEIQYQQRLQKPIIPLPEPKEIDHDRANIIQHPVSSEKLPLPKKISFRGNRIYDFKDFELHYKSKTSGGSSGSPVIDDLGRWIGLHYSSCKKIERILVKQHKIICEKLGYKPTKEQESTKFHYQKGLGQNAKHIYISKDNKGRCARDSDNKEKTTLLEIIHKEYTNPVSLIKEFLDEKKIKKELKHLSCNTAIHVDHIMEDLKKNQSKKLEEKNHAGRELNLKWETEISSSPKTFYKRYKNYFWTVVAIAGTFAYYMYYKKSKKA